MCEQKELKFSYLLTKKKKKFLTNRQRVSPFVPSFISKMLTPFSLGLRKYNRKRNFYKFFEQCLTKHAKYLYRHAWASTIFVVDMLLLARVSSQSLDVGGVHFTTSWYIIYI